MWEKQKHQAGFTIVELLIVIVVIGILAAISITAYNGVQQRARDAQRIDAIAKIRKGLEAYRAINGAYPSGTNSGTSSVGDAYPGGGWEVSQISQSAWLTALKPYMSSVPSDPVNDDSVHYFYYYFYANNPGMCGAATPNCYVLGAAKLDSMNALQISGVDTGGSDIWRNSSATRAVWRGSY
jgi:general secretion pathway protein G